MKDLKSGDTGGLIRQSINKQRTGRGAGGQSMQVKSKQLLMQEKIMIMMMVTMIIISSCRTTWCYK